MNLDQAICFDIETVVNCFTMNVLGLHSEFEATFEISPFRDDREFLFQWFAYWKHHQTPMIGFNSLSFDYPVLHFMYENPACTFGDIYQKAQSIIHSESRFGSIVWESDRFAPQVDLYRIHHFDNPAKSTSLKALEIAMRSETVMDMPLPFDQPLTEVQIRDVLIPYNRHDVRETRKFAHISMDAIKFRIELAETLRGDVLNFNDTKIGSKIVEQRLGLSKANDDDFRPRQTFRTSIALDDIIFPYIRFEHPEFVRILDWMRKQVLSSDELTESTKIKTKGVFTGVIASVGGLEFKFGTGGMHASTPSSRWASDSEYTIYDVDITSNYPSIAIVNGLYPEHLGTRFVEEFAKLPIERNEHKKGTVKNAALKLAGNGTIGNSNNPYSVFYDPQFNMTITINNQFMICMLAEWLLTVPSLRILQCNTDGMTYRIRNDQAEHANIIRRMWERTTKLQLEEAKYSRMWLRDVNNYIAEAPDGKLKQKGAYWFPRNFPDDITNSLAWHKDYSAQVVIKAAVENMVQGTPIERFVTGHADPFDFMCKAKVDRNSTLMIGDRQVQRITRYYVATDGGDMRKISPPVKGAEVGQFKRRNGMSDWEYASVLQTLPTGTWDARIHTKNKSRYEIRETSIEAGWKVAECNRAADFDFERLNYDYYIEAARKLVIPND